MADNTCTACNRTKMKDSAYCFFCSPDVDEEEKHRARRRGGQGSKKVQPWAIPLDFIEWVQEHGIGSHLDLKRLTDSALVWLLSGSISPAQHHAVLENAREARERIRLALVHDLSEVVRSQPDAQLSHVDELDILWRELETNLNESES